MQEDCPLKVDANPLWTNTKSITMYAFDPEDQEFTDVTTTYAPPAYDNGVSESQDSGLMTQAHRVRVHWGGQHRAG